MVSPAIRSAVTLSLVPEARGGPFVFWDNMESGFAAAHRLGFDGVEIFPGAADDLNAHELRERLRRHQLSLAAMGTGAGWVKRKLRLTDPDAAIRREARQFIGAIIDLAGSMGAPAIIGSMQGRWEGAVSRAQALDWLREGLEELGARASTLGVPLLYEPLNRYETNLFHRVQDASEFLAPLRAQNIRLLCDLFHMNIEEASIHEALKQGGARIGHLHFADTNRRAIGFGHLDVAPIAQALREINYTGFISAEILPWPDGESAAQQTIKSFHRWFR